MTNLLRYFKLIVLSTIGATRPVTMLLNPTGIALTAMAVAMAITGTVRAQVVTQVNATSTNYLPNSNTWYQGTNSAAQNWSVSAGFSGNVSNGGSAGVATATASAAGHGILLNSHSEISIGGTTSLTVAGEVLDVIRFTGPQANAPSAVRINVHVHGTVTALQGDGIQAYTRLTVYHINGSNTPLPAAINSYNPAPNSTTFELNRYLGTTTVSDPGPNATNFGFNSSTGEVAWDTSYVLNYDTQLGGYQVNLVAFGETAAAQGGYAAIDFGTPPLADNGISLTRVTYENGSVVPPGVFVFDSGFIPVPEPATIFALGTAALGLAGLRRRVRSR